MLKQSRDAVKPTHRALFDASSVLRACLHIKDEEDGYKVEFDGKQVQINTANHGFEVFAGTFKKTLDTLGLVPIDVIWVKDGNDNRAYRQLAFYPDYKGKRDKLPQDYWDHYGKLNEMVEEALLGMGAQVVTQPRIEADDIIAYLCEELEGHKTVVTRDGDLLALRSDNVDVYLNGEMNPDEKYGPFPTRFITLYKATVGDTSDNMKGAEGFGPAKFIDMYAIFGDEGMEALEEVFETEAIESLEEDLSAYSHLQKIIDSKDSVLSSWKCAKLYPNLINTMVTPLEWQGGMVIEWDEDKHHYLFEDYYGTTLLVTAGNYAETVDFVKDELHNSPFVSLDIETFTGATSDAWAEKAKVSVDVFGSELCGLSVTFGANNEITLYFSVAHKDTNNCTIDQVLEFIKLIPEIPIVVHNNEFEQPVLYNTWGKKWEDNGFHGFLPYVLDSMHMKAYVDENDSKGLKNCSKRFLNYTQTTYAEVTQGRKMNECTGAEVKAYGCDDTICTAALANHFRIIMEIENTWQTYLEVEPSCSYMVAHNFVTGVDLDLDYLAKIAAEDDKVYEANREVLFDYLKDEGSWPGIRYVPFKLTAAKIKEAYLKLTGKSLKTNVRKVEKLAALVEPEAPEFAALLVIGDEDRINEYLKAKHKGNPEINIDSPAQIAELIYEVMGLPVRIRNKPTDKMREKGIKQGKPSTKSLAFAYAFRDDEDAFPLEIVALRALLKMREIDTRRKLYYNSYPNFPHWKDGKVHPSLQQASAVTLRFKPSKPNTAQVPKRGEGIKVRGAYVPHHENALIVAMDEDSQELRLIADRSKDPALTSCFVGDSLKSPHTITGLGIAQNKGYPEWTYEYMQNAVDDENHPDHKIAKKFRSTGKTVNFSVEFGAYADKVAETLFTTKEEAQMYIDAKYAQFPVIEEWKAGVKDFLKDKGYSMSLMKGRRHLGEVMRSKDGFAKSKAERQAVNSEIQRSAGEMIRLAIASAWENELAFKFDARFMVPVHDELVWSVNKADLVEFCKELHLCMTQPYGGMEIPIISTCGIGPNFGSLSEVGSSIDEVKILEIIKEMFHAEEKADHDKTLPDDTSF